MNDFDFTVISVVLLLASAHLYEIIAKWWRRRRLEHGK